jgi:hypothetical protein
MMFQTLMVLPSYIMGRREYHLSMNLELLHCKFSNCWVIALLGILQLLWSVASGQHCKLSDSALVSPYVFHGPLLHLLLYMLFTRLQVSKRLEKTARYFKNLGTLGFWSQLVCTTVSAGILSFSAVATGNATSPFTFYLTALGIVAAFFSVFRSFGYIRLSERLGRTSTEPAKVILLPKTCSTALWFSLLKICCSYELTVFAYNVPWPCLHVYDQLNTMPHL